MLQTKEVFNICRLKEVEGWKKKMTYDFLRHKTQGWFIFEAKMFQANSNCAMLRKITVHVVRCVDSNCWGLKWAWPSRKSWACNAIAIFCFLLTCMRMVSDKAEKGWCEICDSNSPKFHQWGCGRCQQHFNIFRFHSHYPAWYAWVIQQLKHANSKRAKYFPRNLIQTIGNFHFSFLGTSESNGSDTCLFLAKRDLKNIRPPKWTTVSWKIGRNLKKEAGSSSFAINFSGVNSLLVSGDDYPRQDDERSRSRHRFVAQESAGNDENLMGFHGLYILKIHGFIIIYINITYIYKHTFRYNLI